MKNKKNILIVVLLVFSCVFSWNFYFKTYNQVDTVDIHDFPQEIDGWVAKELPITEDEYAVLETKNAFARSYTNPEGKSVYILLVYSQTNRKVAHPPEICYTGGGASINSNTRDYIAIKQPKMEIGANKLLLEYASHKQVSYYWFKIGDSFTPNYWKQQMLIVLKTFAGKAPSAALVRVSANVENNDQQAAEQNIKEFTSLATPFILKYLP